jgi:hypothetical protein
MDGSEFAVKNIPFGGRIACGWRITNSPSTGTTALLPFLYAYISHFVILMDSL